MSELNNCPCCGGQAGACRKLRTYFEKYAVICTECGIRTDDYPTMEMAIEKWNTRKPMDRIVERLGKEVIYQDEKSNEAADDVFEEISVERARRKMGECYGHAIDIVKAGGKDE